MRHIVSKCIPNRRAVPLLPPRLSYRIDDTPLGCQSFPVNICPVRCRTSNPFCHLCRPTSLLLSNRMSSTSVSILVVSHLFHHARPPLSLPMTLSDILIISHIYRTSIVILPCLCCGTLCIIFHCSVYFAAVVCLPSPVGSSPCSVLFCTTLLDPL